MISPGPPELSPGAPAYTNRHSQPLGDTGSGLYPHLYLAHQNGWPSSTTRRGLIGNITVGLTSSSTGGSIRAR